MLIRSSEFDLGSEKPEGFTEAGSPGKFRVVSAGDLTDRELVLPAFGAEERREESVVNLITFIKSGVSIVKIHTNPGWQVAYPFEGKQLSGVLGEALGDVFEGRGEAGKFAKDAGVLEAHAEGEQGTKGRPAKDTGFGLRKGPVAGIEVREQLPDQKLRVSNAPELRRQIDITEGNVVFIVALGMNHGDHKGLRHDAFRMEGGDPFIRRPIHSRETGGRIKNVGSIMKQNHREMSLRFGRIRRRKPDQQLPAAGQDVGMQPVAGQATGIAVLPIGDRVVTGRVQPGVMTNVGQDMTPRIDGFVLPGSPQDFVFEGRAGLDVDFAKVVRIGPLQGQGLGRIPGSKARKAPAHVNRLLRFADRRNDFKSDLTHGTLLLTAFPGLRTEN